MSTRFQELARGWTLTAVGGPVPASVRGRTIPARVPGVVHTDLLAAGLIPDPYLDENESALAWIGRSAWRYTTSFHWEPSGPGERHELVCAGLDTIATVRLNGALAGRAANQHRTHLFDVTGTLRPGRNTLTVTFASALDHAEAADPRPHVNHHPYNAIRKMACNFGWDWGPDLVTAGIWRPIGLRSWRGARIGGVRPLVTGPGQVTFDVDVVRDDGRPLTVTARAGSAEAVRDCADRVTVPVTVDRPEPWWPRGHGGRPLYEASVVLSDGPDVLDVWHGRVGLRTVELDPDRFTLRVNGREVFVRGANWIPDDAFPSRVGADRYARRLDDAVEAGVNLLRVWGGGIYESEEFYRLCDERGVLVWQDFLFACAAYDEERLGAEVAAEAREAVTRLSAHPSLVIWNGGNESLWGHADWGWRDRLDGRSWGAGFYHDLLPGICADLDPTRPYIPNSPYSPHGGHPNDPASGPMHIWDVWNELDYRRYDDHTPRFVAEFGFQGPPAWSTLTAAIHDDPIGPRSPGMRAHQKAEDGHGKLDRGRSGHFPEPRDFTDWHWTTQLNQARAVAFGLERFRSLAPYCGGVILWQLNDCWPVVSWAAVDGYGRRKPMWYALRAAYADRLLTVQARPAGLTVVAVNDSGEPWRTTLRARRLGFDGAELATAEITVDVAARAVTATALPAAVAHPGDPRTELIAVDDPAAGAARAWHFFAEDVDLDLPEPVLTGELTARPGGYDLWIRADSLLRDLFVHLDRLDARAVADPQLITLLPGEDARLTITTATRLTVSDVLTHPVLRTANDLVHPHAARSRA